MFNLLPPRHISTLPNSVQTLAPQRNVALIEDFHLQAVDHARHTRKWPGSMPGHRGIRK